MASAPKPEMHEHALDASMEEILSSIRKIVSEDDAKAARPTVVPAPVAGARTPPVSDEDVSEFDAVFSGRHAGPVDTSPAVVAPREEPMAVRQDDGRLMSPEADATVTASFDSLTNTILSKNARTLDKVVEDMLRPMLKIWIDDNLPSLVERLVRAEIERVSRGGR